MRVFLRTLSQLSIEASTKTGKPYNPRPLLTFQKSFSTQDGGGSKDDDWAQHFGVVGSSGPDPMSWDEGSSSWSTGLTKELFDGGVIGKKVDPDQVVVNKPAAAAAAPDRNRRSVNAAASWTSGQMAQMKELEAANRWAKGFVDGWDSRMRETANLLKQVREPGARGSYLKYSEKAEMYKKHKQNPEEYTVERLAKEYRIMRQRVHAILWLKELEEEEEKKNGPLDDSVEKLLDTCSDFFISHDREFHVATLPRKPDFRVMPENWDGTIRDPDEVHYEISKKEDEMLYQEFVQKFNFNKMMYARKVKFHKYSRRRPPQGWNFTVEKLGPRNKRGNGGGWKFVSEADGSSRPLNDYEKMFVKRETPQRRRKFLTATL